MPFVGVHKLTRERIDITLLERPRDILKSGDVLCQICGEPLIVKAGQIVRAHFAHYAQCDGLFEAHPETPAHLSAKYFLRQRLQQEYDMYTLARIELEVPVPMPWRPKGRIADLMITFPLGWRIAHEVQLASITTEELDERTNDYLRAGIDVIWWLGKSAATNANKRWCFAKFGVCYTIVEDLCSNDS